MDKFKFEQRIKEYLQKQRFSQAEVARRLHVSRSTVNKWIIGENEIAYETLFQLCEVLGLQEKERVELFALAGYQHLPIQAPPAQSNRAYDAILYTRANIAKRPDVLLGRDEILMQVEALLVQAKHLLLTGYGGTGKTALASTLAGRWMEAGKGPVLWFVADSDELDSVLETMTAPFESTLELGSKKGDAKLYAVQTILSQAGVTLVVLDDLSHINMLPYVRGAIPEGTALLVTSRYDAAHIDASIKVEDLAAKEAVALLAHHAQNSIIPRNVYLSDPQSGELCRRLGYHALGIVIAGAWLKQSRRRPHDLVRRLDEGQLSPLNMEMPPSTRLENRESVQKVLQQTYRQLDGKSRALFRAFGQLLTPRATSELLALSVEESVLDVENALDELVSWNFADREGSNTYSLHELVHQYAIELQTQRPEPRQIALILARYSSEYGRDFANLAINLPNLIGVAATVEDQQRIEILRPLFLQGYCDVYGYRLEVLALLDQILAYLQRRAQQGTITQNERNELHYYLSKRGNAHFDRGEFIRATELYLKALTGAPNVERRVKLSSLVAKALTFAGNDGAQSYFAQAYELCGDDDSLLGFVLEQEAHSAGFREDYETARRVAETQVVINKRLLNENLSQEEIDETYESLIHSLLNLGTAELRLGQQPIDYIHKIHEEAMELAEQLDHPELKAHAYWALAEDAHHAGNRTTASHFLNAAYAIYEEQGKTRNGAEVYEFMRRYGYSTPSQLGGELVAGER